MIEMTSVKTSTTDFFAEFVVIMDSKDGHLKKHSFSISIIEL
jgi:hypothetical protein